MVQVLADPDADVAEHGKQRVVLLPGVPAEEHHDADQRALALDRERTGGFQPEARCRYGAGAN